MTAAPEPMSVRFDECSFWLEREDRRTTGVPLARFPRLLHGTPEQRQAVDLSRAETSPSPASSRAGETWRGRAGRRRERRTHVLLAGACLNAVEHARPTILSLSNDETRATEYSKAATRGNWNEVWDNIDRRKSARAANDALVDAAEADMVTRAGVAAE